MTNNNPSDETKKTNPIAIAAVVGVLLLGVIGYLAYYTANVTQQLENSLNELDETQKLKKEIEGQYNQAIADMEGQKTTNQELNAVIDQQKAELEKCKLVATESEGGDEPTATTEDGEEPTKPTAEANDGFSEWAKKRAAAKKNN